MQDDRFASNLKRMSEFRHYEVSDEDPDPRGWTVVTTDGTRIGEVKDLLVDPSALKVRYFEVEVDDSSRADDERVLVDAYNADVVEQDERVIIDGDIASLQSSSGMSAYETGVADDRGPAAGLGDTSTEAARLTRAEEELRIGKREVEAGEVVVNKTIETERVQEPVERRVERVRVERRPVQANAMRDVQIDEGEVRVPIIEEEVVVEKRPVVKEEIVVTRDAGTETEVIDTEVRKERVDVHEDGTSRRGGNHGGY